MAKCTYCQKKIEMRPSLADRANKVKRPRMEWVEVIDKGWATEIRRSHSVTEFEPDPIPRLSKNLLIGSQDHYIGDEAPPIWYEGWYLEEHPELSNEREL